MCIRDRPYIEHGRHIEVQILGDSFGNVVHLGERECSIQRRNQKVIEEAPSAGIIAATRTAVCEGALALARHVGYCGAGTVEFLVGGSDDPSSNDAVTITFLEVNTRLQVEHPVTEAVTGLDLVEWQLRIAAGEPLTFGQDDVACDGHAIEVRLVAEDPAAGWLPSTGVVDTFAIGDEVRTDTGIRPGTEVSADYDSLLAKVIAHAPTRTGAARRLARALRTADMVKGSRWVQGGSVVNWPWHRKLLSQGGSLWSRTLLGLPIKDVTGGFTAFRADTLRGIAASLEESSCQSRHNASGATFIDNFPDAIWKYVPIHELGHTFGLCHVDGLDRIMVSSRQNSLWSWSIPYNWCVRGEPYFLSLIHL